MTFAIEVNLLTGKYVATSHHSRSEPEWPPHPARLYSALVANHKEYPPDDGRAEATEREALEWLEAQVPPSVTASDEIVRTVAVNYVPINDESVIDTSPYRKRYQRLAFTLSQLDDVEPTDDASRRLADRLSNEASKCLDVASLADAPGRTSSVSAAALLPDDFNRFHVYHAKKKKWLGERTKKGRYFPCVVPDESRVTYTWDSSPPEPLAEALDGMLQRVTRLGHSSSLVSCLVRKAAPEPTFIPAPAGADVNAGDRRLRWVGAGQLASLEQRYTQHQGIRPRALPFRTVRYQRPQTAEAAGALPCETTGEMLVFEFDPQDRRLPATRTVELCNALRGALLHYAADPAPEGLSGHRPDGRPTPDAHVAFAALPDVAHQHASGRVMGMAVVIPGSLRTEARRATLLAIGAWERTVGGEPDGDQPLELRLRGGATYRLRRLVGGTALVSLREHTWAGRFDRPSRRWVSATPIALPTNPGRLASGSHQARAKAWAKAEQAVVAACAHVGLPEPSDLAVSLTPFIRGALRAADYPTFKQGSSSTGQVVRRLVHAMVEFNRPVHGPLLLGSGRFYGLGLMRPLEPPRQAEEGGDGDD